MTSTSSLIVTAEARLTDASNRIMLAYGKLGEAASAQVLGGNPRDRLLVAKREIASAQAAIDKAWSAVCAASADPKTPTKGDNFRVISGGKPDGSPTGPGDAA